MQMHVLIYDPMHTGHHLNWVRLLIEAAEPYATRITFATTAQASRSAEFSEHLGHLTGRFDLDLSTEPIAGPDRPFEGLRVARRAWFGLRSAIARNKPDHVFVAFADAMLRAPLTISRADLELGMDPENVEGISISTPYAFRRDLPWRKQLRILIELFGIARLPIGRLMLLTPLTTDWLNRYFPSIAKRCQSIPDAIIPVTTTDKTTARAALGLPTDGRFIGCIGVLDSRKGVDEFVRSFAAAPLNSDDRLLLAGNATTEVTIAVEAARKKIGTDRIILLDRTLSNNELDLAVSAVDLLSITYRFPGHVGMSSMLIRATAAARPVLSMPQGWPGYITRKLSLGWIYPKEQSARLRAIKESLDASINFTLSKEAMDLVNFHSKAHLREIFTARLQQRIQIPIRRLAA